MSQKDKELLLADLCARLPYGVKISTNRGPELMEALAPFSWMELKISGNFDFTDLVGFKPYLRSMSSMTEEENKEAKENGCIIYCDTSPEDKGLLVFASPKGFDWLNKKMFDYRKDDEGKTMIEKGLALEAPKGMYN